MRNQTIDLPTLQVQDQHDQDGRLVARRFHPEMPRSNPTARLAHHVAITRIETGADLVLVKKSDWPSAWATWEIHHHYGGLSSQHFFDSTQEAIAWLRGMRHGMRGSRPTSAAPGI